MIALADLRLAARMRGGTTRDEYLKALERAAVDSLQAMSGHYFGAVDTGFLEFQIGYGDRELFLLEPQTPGGTPLVVTEHQTVGDVGVVIAPGDVDGYVVRGDTDRKIVRKGGAVWLSGHEYELVYDRGYESGKEPARARTFVTKLVVHWFERETPMPRVGEVHTFPVPLHIQSILGTLKRLKV